MSSPEISDWVLACGGFHDGGGMDRANAALAEYLASTGARVHLVAHAVAQELQARAGITPTIVPRTAGSVLAGELTLERQSGRVAAALRRQGRSVLLVANGGNNLRGDVNWVHSVHHAWPPSDSGAPPWFKVKNRGARWWSRRRERIAIRAARVVIANSDRTKHDVVTHLGVPANRVHTVYIGSAPGWSAPSDGERGRARREWCRDAARPLVAFVGALGHDTNKGIDTLIDAWERLRSGGGWDADLVVAGPGHVRRWEQMAGSTEDVRFAGFTDRIGDLLNAADLLVSPVRYEAYGLAIHEAICRGVPVLVSGTAGIVERFHGAVDDLLLRRPDDAEELALKLRAWRDDRALWRRRFEDVQRELLDYGLRDMAARIVEIATAGAVRPGASV